MGNFSAKRYFFSLLILLIISLAVLVYEIITVNPTTVGFVKLFLFFLTIFLVGWSGFSLLGYVVRIYVSRNSPLPTFARISLRQGAMISGLLVAALYLQSLRALSVLSILLIIVSLTLLELAFLSR